MPGLKAKNRLFDIIVDEVTLTKSPAVPKGNFVLIKSNISSSETSNRQTIEKQFLFKSVDKVKKQVFGYTLVPNEADYQEDAVSVDEVEKACNSYMSGLALGKGKGTGTGLEHQVFIDIGYPIQSCIDIDGSLAKAHNPEAEGISGAWWLGVQIENDGIWDQVEKGEITGFSIGGYGKREPIEEEEANKSLFQKLKKMVGLSKVDSVAISYTDAVKEEKDSRELMDMIWTLERSLRSIMADDKIKDKKKSFGESIGQFAEDMNGHIESVEKAKMKKQSNAGDETMTEEQLAKFTGAIDTLNESVTKLTESMAKESDDKDDKTKDDKDDKTKDDKDNKKKDDKTKDDKDDKDNKKKDDVDKSKDEELETKFTDSIEELTKSIDKLQKDVGKLKGTPNDRKGSSDSDSLRKTNDDDDDDKRTAIEKGGLVGTAFDIPISS